MTTAALLRRRSAGAALPAALALLLAALLAAGLLSLWLTPREREILDRIARGQNNGAIAAQLGLAPKTVGNHVSAIFAKLRVASRAEAIVRARDEGLGRTPP